MSTLPVMDNILYNVQRQGKISFYVRTLGSSYISIVDRHNR